MNIQIFGRTKDFDTKKAERFFKERRISFQSVDLNRKGLSKGELNSVISAVGGLDLIVDDKCKDQDLYAMYRYLHPSERLTKVMENPVLLKAPIVRNGRKATVGYSPEEWQCWIDESNC
jgi:arsenate reductase